VLESSPALRTSGFAFMTWTNAFRALDALGVGDKMRSQHVQVQGYISRSSQARHLTFIFHSCLMPVRDELPVHVLLDRVRVMSSVTGEVVREIDIRVQGKR
jgi:2-polyprenyl-6-methoxyphenol hydroxylase-like FAD-dependent oxidoreductase